MNPHLWAAFYAVISGFLYTLVSGSKPNLSLRQNNPFASLPAQCQTSCDAIENTFQNCSTDSCFCTAANFNALQACLQCAIDAASGGALASQIQQDLNGLVQDCQSEGFPVPSATLSGVQSPTSNGNPQSPSASSSASAILSQTSGQSTTAPSGSSTGSQPLSTNTSSSTSGDGPAKSFIYNSLISNIILAFYMFCYLGL
ncbi:hypothetical protein SISSUDRAFT_1127856 [Sistotremastrum suecicum HHB10207 ss-3]|uniref:Extracellular membrane protein CFEM domain-containing protein n=1 Tax=Sistotremastrum suecicum HHB10207 ss-3 TaxID=1314776 RepID=A0A166EMI8_9AGAM|nr:hypothetical protein SISSUDRAFT_1127856 [Sistotremastrum suecicum HHB10207 ss-3]